MSLQITAPHYSDNPDVQAAFEASYVASYQASFAEGHAEGVREAHAAAFAEGERLGEIEQRERCAAILSSPEARGRESTAKRLAFESDLDAATVIGVLATVPKDTAGASIAERHAGAVIAFPRGA